MFPSHELPNSGGNAKETARLRLREVHIHLRGIQKPIFLRICGFLFVGASNPTPWLENAQSLFGVKDSYSCARGSAVGILLLLIAAAAVCNALHNSENPTNRSWSMVQI